MGNGENNKTNLPGGAANVSVRPHDVCDNDGGSPDSRRWFSQTGNVELKKTSISKRI